MAAPAGWYEDPTQTGQFRYFDGAAWTEHIHRPEVAAPQAPRVDRAAPRQTEHRDVSSLASDVQAERDLQLVREIAESKPASQDSAGVSIFSAKKLAKQLQADSKAYAARAERAEELVVRYGLLSVDERMRMISEADAHARKQHEHLADVARELADVESRLVEARATAELQDTGLFYFENPAEASVTLKDDLDSIRREIKAQSKPGIGVTYSDGFSFNNSMKEGEKFAKNMAQVMLAAYNAEAENCVKSAKAGNLESAKSRLMKSRERIQKAGVMLSLQVTAAYHNLRVREIELATRHLQAVQAEREVEKEHRAALREQAQVEAEMKKAQEKLTRERTLYAENLAKLVANGDEAGAERLRETLAEVDEALENVNSRAANQRAGYVYVISNHGAFGSGVVKIGMTRRLEPMDRVKELGDASVPFNFDVHALFFSDDAVSTENMLHKTFSDQRINKVNLRREFFRVSPEQVLGALREHRVEVLEFNLDAPAEQFRASWPGLDPKAAFPNVRLDGSDEYRI